MSSSPPDVVNAVLARGKLGTFTLVFFVMAAAAPLTVVAGGATTGFAVTGVTGIPVAYLAVAAVLGLFSVGFVAMSRRIVNAGAFYTYVAHGLGKPLGVAIAFLALAAYNAMQVGLYGGFGPILESDLAARTGINVPWWLCAYAALAVIAVLGVLRIDLNGKILAAMLVGEIAIALVYDAVMVTHPAGNTVSFDTLAPDHLLAAGIGAALVTAITGFVGFEATTVLAEEVKDPRRTVARATYIAVTVTGVLYGLSAWAMSVATGPDRIVNAAGEQGTDLMFNLVSPYVASEIVSIGRILFITSLFAALLSFHHTVARYLFALGRERVLPSALARTGRRTLAPVVGSLTQTAIAAVVLAGYVWSGADPIVNLFFWITVTGGLGVLVLMTITSVAVVAFFARRRHDENVWRAAIAPAMAALVLGAILFVTVQQFDTLLGVAPTSPLRWLFPAGYAAVAVLGLAWALYLRRSRPDVYDAIGLGVEAESLQHRHAAPARLPA
ncbi:amino acid permease [Micromonospora tulbaghiae]|uniref:Amino acid permease n=1 Tax=Micromonospora tulbaghiae TaxID=479978 RepID=A0A386WEY8_9ACTN|nr:APC family permease [Micromonospora tulbaghiae]AYF26643.1 amino acid permease [Micromonospora tulbaghiae]